MRGFKNFGNYFFFLKQLLLEGGDYFFLKIGIKCLVKVIFQ